MLADNASRSQLDATIESLRYWVPTIADVARVGESEQQGGWMLEISPSTAGACPVAVVLRDPQRFDFRVAGETYIDRTIASYELMLPLLEAITVGRVMQRAWISRATGMCRAIETIITLADGTSWRDGRTLEGAAESIARDDTERHDRHFLPYRR